MAEAVSNAAAVPYWATSLGGNHVAAQEWTNVLKAAVTGGEEDTTYHCTATLQVSVIDGEGGTKPESFTANDNAILYLELADGLEDAGATLGTKSLDLKDIGTTNTSELAFDITGADTTAKDLVKISFKVENASQEKQDNLVDKSFQIQLATTSFECDPKAA